MSYLICGPSNISDLIVFLQMKIIIHCYQEPLDEVQLDMQWSKYDFISFN